MNFSRVNIICGHYGSGKTNLAVNFAILAARSGKKTILVDLDIVNPYFRAADSTEALNKHNIKLIAPLYANTNLEVMALPAEVASAFSDKSAIVFFDVGGDDSGAVALGRYHNFFAADDTKVFYVLNQRRPLTLTAHDSAEILSEVESAGRIKVDCVINNTNLGKQTTVEAVIEALPAAQQVMKQCGCNEFFTTIRRDLYDGLENTPPDFYPVDIYTQNFFDCCDNPY